MTAMHFSGQEMQVPLDLLKVLNMAKVKRHSDAGEGMDAREVRQIPYEVYPSDRSVAVPMTCEVGHIVGECLDVFWVIGRRLSFDNVANGLQQIKTDGELGKPKYCMRFRRHSSGMMATSRREIYLCEYMQLKNKIYDRNNIHSFFFLLVRVRYGKRQPSRLVVCTVHRIWGD